MGFEPERLKKYLKKRGIKQKDLATMLGVSNALISHLFNHRISYPQEMLRTISEKLGLDANLLFDGKIKEIK